MAYSGYASSLNKKSTTLNEFKGKIDEVNFSGCWEGDAYNKQKSNLDNLIAALTDQATQINTFASVILKIDEYDAEKINYNNANDSLNKLSKNAKASEKQVYINAMNTASRRLETLRVEINNGLKSISTMYSSTLNNIPQTELVSTKEIFNDSVAEFGKINGNSFDIIDPSIGLLFGLNGDSHEQLEQLYAMFANGQLTFIPNGYTLADYYNQVDENGNVIPGSGMKFINDQIAEVQKHYKGREAVVQSCLLFFQLCAAKGVRVPYKHAGTTLQSCYVLNEALVDGIDCNPMAAWLIDKGVETRFMWRPVQDFQHIGNRLPYEAWANAQPGDVVTSGGHVAVIIENDPNTRTFTIAEAKGQAYGIILNKKTYETAYNAGNVVQDMTNIYNGTVNTDRKKEFPNLFPEYV